MTPLLLAVQKYHGCEPAATGLVSLLSHSLWGTVSVAFFIIVSLPDLDVYGYALSAIPVVALLVIYITLTPRTDGGSRLLPYVDIERAICPLAIRVAILLLIILNIKTISFGFPRAEILTTMSLGMAKALNWYFVIQTVRFPLKRPVWRLPQSGSTFLLARCHCNRHIRDYIQSQPLYAIIRSPSHIARYWVTPRPWTGYPYTPTAGENKVCSLGYFSRTFCSISRQYRGHQTRRIVTHPLSTTSGGILHTKCQIRFQ